MEQAQETCQDYDGGQKKEDGAPRHGHECRFLNQIAGNIRDADAAISDRNSIS
jgi:hypothetical protein